MMQTCVIYKIHTFLTVWPRVYKIIMKAAAKHNTVVISIQDKTRQDKIYFESARHITIKDKLQEAFEPTI